MKPSVRYKALKTRIKFRMKKLQDSQVCDKFGRMALFWVPKSDRDSCKKVHGLVGKLVLTSLLKTKFDQYRSVKFLKHEPK